MSGFSDNNDLVIIYEDNGPGVDSEKLLEKMAQQNMGVVYNLPVIELLRKTSEKNISTKNKADHLSGHGIGMAAIFALIDSYSGQLDYQQSDLGGAAFKIKLPNVIIQP